MSCRLIETNRGVPYNPKAYNLLVSNGKDIIQAIIAMLYNAGDLRLGQFEENDLLVIDCLKPCLDFLSSLTATSRELLELVNADMHMRLNSIINNDTAFLDTPEGQVNFFVGIILLRRGFLTTTPTTREWSYLLLLLITPSLTLLCLKSSPSL